MSSLLRNRKGKMYYSCMWYLKVLFGPVAIRPPGLDFKQFSGIGTRLLKSFCSYLMFFIPGVREKAIYFSVFYFFPVSLLFSGILTFSASMKCNPSESVNPCGSVSE